MQSPKVLALALTLFLISTSRTSDISSTVDWPNFQFEEIGFVGVPTHITHANDGSGRLFVVEKTGMIRQLVMPPATGNVLLDLRSKILVIGAEQGLFSMAFAPNFKTSGELYVNYTRRPDGATVVSRFKHSEGTNSIDIATEQVLLVVPQPAANHNGGQIAFGPDGYLYVGMGDGGGQGDPNLTAQNPASLLGKMLRIDVSGSHTNYLIPATNPFLGKKDFLPEIWALGLRNPWRFSFDRLTGDLYIADVGEARMEEINFQPASSLGGENYGWSFYEGTLPFKIPTNDFFLPQITFPIATYDRLAGRSITGGHVIRRTSTDRTFGIYVFADYVTGRFGALKRMGTNWARIDYGVLRNPAGERFQIMSFGEDEEGNLLAVERGVAYRLIDSKVTHPPIISPGSGTYTNELLVTLDTFSPGAQMHYTLDGSEPTADSPFVERGGSVSITRSSNLKVKAFRPDLQPSATVSVQYTLRVPLTMLPHQGPVTNGTPLVLTTTVTNAIIRYTLDGSAPSETSPVYTGPITLSGNQSIRISVLREGWSTTETNVYFGLLLPEWIVVQTIAGGGKLALGEASPREIRLPKPWSIAISSSADIYIGDLGSPIGASPAIPAGVYRIRGQGMGVLVTNLGPPNALFASTNGVFVAVPHTIYRVSDEANVTIYNNGSQGAPRSIDVDTSGTTWVMDRQSLLATSSANTLLSYTSLFESADLGALLMPDAKILIGGGYGLFTRTGAGELLPYAGGTVSDYPSGHADGPRLTARFAFPLSGIRPMMYDASWNLFVGDHNRIRKIDTNGNVSTLIESRGPAKSIGMIAGAALHPNGDVYVVDISDAKVKRLSLDVDRDGIPDLDESAAPFLVGADDAALDNDSDGASNALEYLSGTNPLNPESTPALLVQLSGSQMQLRWSGSAPRGMLVLEQSTDLENWQVLEEQFYSGPITRATDTERLFFRVRIE